MPVTIKTNQAFKDLGKILPDARNKFSKEMKSNIFESIKGEMQKGTSPVKGFNPYKKKKDGTRAKLFKTGELYESIKIIQRKSGLLTIKAGGAKAPYTVFHQFGTANLDARPILPTRGLSFKKTLFDKILGFARKAVRQAAKKRG